MGNQRREILWQSPRTIMRVWHCEYRAGPVRGQAGTCCRHHPAPSARIKHATEVWLWCRSSVVRYAADGIAGVCDRAECRLADDGFTMTS